MSLNISVLFSDAYLVCEDMLVGLPVLRHLQIDSRTLPEINLYVFDRLYCAAIVIRTRQ